MVEGKVFIRGTERSTGNSAPFFLSFPDALPRSGPEFEGQELSCSLTKNVRPGHGKWDISGACWLAERKPL